MKRIGLSLLCLAVVACSALKVRVEILDPDHLDLKAAEQKLARVSAQLVRLRASKLLKQRDAMLASLARRNPRLSSTIKTKLKALDAEGGRYLTAYKSFSKARKPASRRAKLAEALEALGRRQKIAREVNTDFARGGSVGAPMPKAPGVGADLTGARILRDPLLALAVSSPDDAWHEFNRAQATGEFGATEVAIKQENIGTYSVKGLRFDPSVIAQLATRFTTQALSLLARVGGVSPRGKGGAAPVPGANPGLAQLEHNIITAKGKLHVSRQAIFAIATEAARLARMIEVVPKKEWTKQLPKLRRALQTLRNTFDAYKANLTR